MVGGLRASPCVWSSRSLGVFREKGEVLGMGEDRALEEEAAHQETIGGG